MICAGSKQKSEIGAINGVRWEYSYRREDISMMDEEKKNHYVYVTGDLDEVIRYNADETFSLRAWVMDLPDHVLGVYVHILRQGGVTSLDSLYAEGVQTDENRRDLEKALGWLLSQDLIGFQRSQDGR